MIGEAVRISARWMLLGVVAVVGVAAALFGAVALAALATANLLARQPETEYHLRLWVNPDPDPAPPERPGELADMNTEDLRLLVRWVRAYREAMGG
jgi:hypothetical protein